MPVYQIIGEKINWGIEEPAVTAGSSAPGLGAMIKQAGEHYEWDGPEMFIGGAGYIFCVYTV